MFKEEINQPPLNEFQARAIKNEAERKFALSCLAVGCLVWHQVPIGNSIIDFLVVNPKVKTFSEKKGTLVEVTCMQKKVKDAKMIGKKVNGKKRRVANRNGERKNRQIKAMEESGYRWTVLYWENLKEMFVKHC